MKALLILTIFAAGGLPAAQPDPQATVNRFFESAGQLTGSLRSVRLKADVSAAASELAERLKAEGFEPRLHEPGGEIRVGVKMIPIVGANWWRRLEAPASRSWVDIIELPDDKGQKPGPEQWIQSHTGSTFTDAFAYITRQAPAGMDSVGAVAVRGRFVINVGESLPFKVMLWDSPGNSESEIAALGQSIDRLAGVLETTVRTMADPSFVTWIPPARLNEEMVRMRRVASFARLWSEAKYNFVFLRERKNVDWESVLEIYLPRIMAAKSNEEYLQVLKEAVALLADGHTGVSGGPAADQPPVRIEPVEGRPVVTGVADLPEIRVSAVKPGMELVSVDGTAVAELSGKLRAIVSGSTPQERENTLASMLLQGKPGSMVEAEFRGLDGKATRLQLKRNQMEVARSALPWRKPAFEYKELPGNIAYVALNSFGSASVVKRFDEHFDRIQKAAGLIIDVRENGGGSSGNGYSIVARLIEKGAKLKTTAWKTRVYKPAFRAWGREEEWHEGTHGEIEARGEEPFRGPVVVLIGSNTFSAAEDFLAPLKMSRRATLVGTPTGGSTGQPLGVPLYQANARICTKWDRFADGTEFVGVGVQPDVRVEATRADVAAGRDAVLEKGLELLRR